MNLKETWQRLKCHKFATSIALLVILLYLFIEFEPFSQKNEVPFKDLGSINGVCLKERNYMVRNPLEWQELWDRAKSGLSANSDFAPPLPEIDFSNHTLLISSRGVKSTTAYGVKIENITETDLQILVTYSKWGNMAGGFLFTCHNHAVLIPATSKRIKFNNVSNPLMQVFWVSVFVLLILRGFFSSRIKGWKQLLLWLVIGILVFALVLFLLLTTF